MKRPFLSILFVLCIFSLLSKEAFPKQTEAAELSAREIVKRSDDLMRGDTQQGTYIMTIITPQWKRRLEIAFAGKDRDKMFLRILSPAKEKGTATLRIGNEMWNYLPSVERVIKIPPSLMLQPWMGSDFANDDLVKESSVVNDYTHEITAEEIIDKEPAYKITLLPKPRAAVVWAKRVMWINKNDFTPIRDEYYGKGGKLIKVLRYSQVKKVGDRRIPTRWEMVSIIKEGRFTIIEVTDNVVYNKSIGRNVFTLQNLRKGL
ncbi:MAG: outer membrane lipoprotein-sorting protein [Candidatus Omnitrophota bacterium]